jgi:hypothetical protein
MEDDRCKLINEKLHINNYSWIILVFCPPKVGSTSLIKEK